MSNLMLYVVSVLIWGSTWLAINYQVESVDPKVSVVYRYAIAAILLFAWCLARRLKLRFDRAAHGRFLLLGIFLFSLNYIGTYSAQQYISSALNAVTFSTMMWMNVINTRIFFGTPIKSRVYFGAALGMVGIIVLFWPELADLNLSEYTLIGAGFCLSAALLASFGNMVSQKSQREGLPVLQANAWGMLYGTLITGAIALVQGAEFVFTPTTSYIVSLLYLAVFGSIVAFGTYLKLVGNIGAEKAGYAVVMFPVVALILAVLFEGLAIETHLVIGVIAVLLGNVVILVTARQWRTLWRWFTEVPPRTDMAIETDAATPVCADKSAR